MSDQDESEELKAGHPPAVKVGGMRVVQHKQAGSGDAAPSAAEEAKDAEEYGAVEQKPDPHHQSVLVSGAPTKGDKDFMPEAVKSYHVKPLPTHADRDPPRQHKMMHIQQPR